MCQQKNLLDVTMRALSWSGDADQKKATGLFSLSFVTVFQEFTRL